MHFYLQVLSIPGAVRLFVPQGPDTGSPFVDASLPFDQLKAPPDSAFEILMICLGVALLAALVTAAFLAVGKLGSLQEQLRKEFAQRAKGAATESDQGTAQLAAALQSSVDELRLSLEQGAKRMEDQLEGLRVPGAPGASDPVPSETGSLEAMKDLTASLASFHGSAEAQANRLAEQVEALAGAISSLPVASPAASSSGAGPLAAPQALMGSAPSASAPSVAGAIQGARSHLSALGYVDIEIVTPSSEINAALVAQGALTVEAKRRGATFKGRVLMEGGQVVDVQLRPSHKIFP